MDDDFSILWKSAFEKYNPLSVMKKKECSFGLFNKKDLFVNTRGNNIIMVNNGKTKKGRRKVKLQNFWYQRKFLS